MKKDLRGTWKQAIVTFLFPFVLVFAVRWAVFEPFVIPSESMMPGLMVHDFIVVNKMAYGIRIPFTETFMAHWSNVQRGDVIVFRYPENPDIFFIKRAVAVAGDSLEVKNDQLIVNGQPIPQEALPKGAFSSEDESRYDYFSETLNDSGHIVRRIRNYGSPKDYGPQVIPEGQVFAMGDNRDESQDSRFWGFVPTENLMGRASLIWLSCSETLPSADFVCDPKTIRWDRIMKSVN